MLGEEPEERITRILKCCIIEMLAFATKERRWGPAENSSLLSDEKIINEAV